MGLPAANDSREQAGEHANRALQLGSSWRRLSEVTLHQGRISLATGEADAPRGLDRWTGNWQDWLVRRVAFPTIISPPNQVLSRDGCVTLTQIRGTISLNVSCCCVHGATLVAYGEEVWGSGGRPDS